MNSDKLFNLLIVKPLRLSATRKILMREAQL